MCRRRAESRELEEEDDEEEEESIQDIPSFIPYNLLTQARQTHTHTHTERKFQLLDAPDVRF